MTVNTPVTWSANYDPAVAERARRRMEPGETLLYCDREKISLGAAVLTLICGLYIAFCGLFLWLSEWPGVTASTVFMLLFGMIFTYFFLLQAFRAIQNFYFVTDKRLCIYEVNYLGKAKKRDFPANSIQEAYLVISTDENIGKTTHIKVKAKNGKPVGITPLNARAMLSAIRKIAGIEGSEV